MKNKNKKLRKEKGIIALSQIFLLILSTIAFSYLLASSLPLVSGASGQQVCVKKSSYGNWETWNVPGGYNTAEEYCNDIISKGTVTHCTAGPCSADESSGGEVNLGQVPISAATNIGAREIGETFSKKDESNLIADVEKSREAAEEEARKSLQEGDSTWSAVKTGAGYVVKNAAVAAGIYATISWGLQKLGVDTPEAGAWGRNIAIGYFAGSIIGAGLGNVWIFSVGGLWGVLAGFIFTWITWKDYRYYQVTFTCMPWDSQKGREYCDLCNHEDIPCTEYRCMSLGTYCEYSEEDQLCFFNDRIDTNPPIISLWKDVLTEGYKYSDESVTSPPDRGVKIVNPEDDEGCIEPFTPIRIGIALDKPARCKISAIGGRSYEDMGNIFMDGGLNYNHSFIIPPIPSAGAMEANNITFREGAELSVYIRCQTRQEISSPMDFAISFCVDDGPDTEEPKITRTSIINNSPISYFDEGEEREADLTIYTNEPAQCRWSTLEQAYEDMPIVNQVNCPFPDPKNVNDKTNAGDYACEETTLTGLKNRENKDYYISCIDQPHLEGEEDEYLRNAMEIPYPFRLIGTQPLILDSAEPDDTIIRDSTDVIKVMLKAKTSAGFDKGKSNCYFKSSTDDESRYVLFLSDRKYDNYEHEQPLDYLTAGDYSYDIRCVDLGGNAATTTISFTIETDTTAPTIVRAFREGDYLKIITSEDAKCVYNDVLTIDRRYDFEDGTEMDRDKVEYGTSHSLPWNSDKTFYIKCEDEFKNRPNQDKCSIIARPYGD